MDLRLIIILVLCQSCFSPMIDEQVFSVEEEIIPYYNQFIQDGKSFGVDYSGANVIISFTEHEDNAYGKASFRDDQIARITIDKSLFESISRRNDTTRIKYIMYHEFGHAFMRLRHVDDCNSIMYADHGCSWRGFEQNQKPMIRQLFLSR